VRVSLLPTVMLAISYSVLVVFTFNILLLEFGAADFSGTTAAFATVTQIGPIVRVLVVAGGSLASPIGTRCGPNRLPTSWPRCPRHWNPGSDWKPRMTFVPHARFGRRI
jgi:hypothetical protein